MLAMYPSCRSAPEFLERSRALPANLNGHLSPLSRQLADWTDELARAIRVRERAEA
jgi:hypothetical protein